MKQHEHFWNTDDKTEVKINIFFSMTPDGVIELYYLWKLSHIKIKVKNTLTGRQKAIKAGDRQGGKNSQAEKQSVLEIDSRGQLDCQQIRSQNFCISPALLFIDNTEGALRIPRWYV